MTISDTVNGWKNYETWCVSLWLSNDQFNYQATRELAQGVHDDSEDDAPYRARCLADALRDYVDEMPEVTAVTEGPASFVCDLLGAALSSVDWYEIAENLLSDVDA